MKYAPGKDDPSRARTRMTAAAERDILKFKFHVQLFKVSAIFI
jgi:hypothetical protein